MATNVGFSRQILVRGSFKLVARMPHFEIRRTGWARIWNQPIQVVHEDIFAALDDTVRSHELHKKAAAEKAATEQAIERQISEDEQVKEKMKAEETAEAAGQLSRLVNAQLIRRTQVVFARRILRSLQSQEAERKTLILKEAAGHLSRLVKQQLVRRTQVSPAHVILRSLQDP